MKTTGTRQESSRDDGGLCHRCGAEVAGVPHVRDEHGKCCEACFLNARYGLMRMEQEGDATAALVETLAKALDAREHETGLHSKRVACHTVVLAKHFTQDSEQLRQIYWGALLHDIGKIGIADSILLKRGALNDSEWKIMRTHPEIGYRILSAVPNMSDAKEMVLSHEERFDGTGYPRNLSGTNISLWARLFAVIDTLDSITSDRPYRKALSFCDAVSEIHHQSGRQFDPVVIKVFSDEQETLKLMVSLKCGADLEPQEPWG